MAGWIRTRHGLSVAGVGEPKLLAPPMSAFFASRQCPGSAIRAAMDWTLQQAQARRVVVVSVASTAARLTSELAIARNQLVAQLAP